MSDEKQFLDADEILATEDVEYAEVYIPMWKTHIRLRTLTGAQAIKFAAAGEKGTSAVDIVAACAVKADGSPLFTAEQAKALREKSLPAILKIQDVAIKLNGFGDKVTKQKVEEAKNA